MKDTLTLDQVVQFVEDFNQMRPAEKCTVHAPAGSGGSTGLFNLSTIDILKKWMTRNIPKYCDCDTPVGDHGDISICAICGNEIIAL